MQHVFGAIILGAVKKSHKCQFNPTSKKVLILIGLLLASSLGHPFLHQLNHHTHVSNLFAVLSK